MQDAAIYCEESLTYPHSAPFDPDADYPEIRQLELPDTDPGNKVYAAVRHLLRDLKLDEDRFGTESWNPLGTIIQPGNRVLIKPNLVLHHNKGSKDIDAVVTHASVIRPLIDYALIALRGAGEVIVGDAPHGDAHFNKIVRANGLQQLVAWYADRTRLPVRLVDFRKYAYPNGFDVSTCRQINRDPEGYVLVDLGAQSHLCSLANLERLYGSDYDRSFIVRQHTGGRHCYLISQTVLNADVVISAPKLKTHKKTGVTINLKNLVGINGDKNYLAHYRIGAPSEGGDEYPESSSSAVRLIRWYSAFSRDRLLAPNKQALRYLHQLLRLPFRAISLCRQIFGRPRFVGGGNWHGNDTCWRMCLDLNHILRFADKNGAIMGFPQRKQFCLVDGIIAGEGNGPMTPDPRNAGFLAAGGDPFKTDYVCTHVMGLDPDKIQLLRQSIGDARSGFDPKALRVSCRYHGDLADYRDVHLRFRPHVDWVGHIERNN
jgi:uncharacterized protein (DUF362 family)